PLKVLANLISPARRRGDRTAQEGDAACFVALKSDSTISQPTALGEIVIAIRDRGLTPSIGESGIGQDEIHDPSRISQAVRMMTAVRFANQDHRTTQLFVTLFDQ